MPFLIEKSFMTMQPIEIIKKARKLITLLPGTFFLSFLGELQVDVIRSILEKEPIEPCRFNPDIPDKLNELIMKMMYKDPNARPTEIVLRQTVAQYL